jgi:flagella synthesis protein FlgN
VSLRPPVAADVRGLLADEVAGVREFVALLEQEQSMLAGRIDIEALTGLVQQKNDISQRLGQLTASREKLIAPAAVGHKGREAMEAWLSTQQPADPAHALWAELLSLAAEARRLNETNGKLINLHLQHNQQALALLMNAANHAVTYGADGQQRTGGGTRLLGSA